MAKAKTKAKPKSDPSSGELVIAVNRRARYDYEILDTHEAGMMLVGSEVKSLRDGKANLKDSYARLVKGELFLWKCHIAPYAPATHFGHDPERQRKLLLHRKEIDKLGGQLKEKGLTLIPLRLYFKNGKAKLLLGLGRGKRAHDKRDTIRAREMDREAARAMRRGNRN